MPFTTESYDDGSHRLVLSDNGDGFTLVVEGERWEGQVPFGINLWTAEWLVETICRKFGFEVKQVTEYKVTKVQED